MAPLTLNGPPTAGGDFAEEGSALTRGALLALAALTFVVAGATHLLVVAENPGDWWEYVAFFLITGILQLTCAVMLIVRPTTWVLLTGISGNIAILGMYLYTRTWGIPLGPAVRAQEPAGTLDIVAAVSEVAAVILLCAALSGRTRRVVVNLIGLLGLGLWVGRMTGVIL